jgi:hypothetical protein
MTGSAQVAIAAPAGLSVALTGIPSFVGRAGGHPQLLYRVGRLAVGTALGWLAPVDLVATPQLVYPLPPLLDLLGVDLLAGVTATIDEVLAPAAAAAVVMPWDRNPTTLTQVFGGYVNGGNSLLSGGSYTVPAGRKLLIGSLFASVTRTALATTLNNTQGYIRRGALTLAYLIDWQNVVGNHVDYDSGVGDLVLLPGEVFSMEMNSQDAGGTHYATASISGILFDA